MEEDSARVPGSVLSVKSVHCCTSVSNPILSSSTQVVNPSACRADERSVKMSRAVRRACVTRVMLASAVDELRIHCLTLQIIHTLPAYFPGRAMRMKGTMSMDISTNAGRPYG